MGGASPSCCRWWPFGAEQRARALSEIAERELNGALKNIELKRNHTRVQMDTARANALKSRSMGDIDAAREYMRDYLNLRKEVATHASSYAAFSEQLRIIHRSHNIDFYNKVTANTSNALSHLTADRNTVLKIERSQDKMSQNISMLEELELAQQDPTGGSLMSGQPLTNDMLDEELNRLEQNEGGLQSLQTLAKPTSDLSLKLSTGPPPAEEAMDETDTLSNDEDTASLIPTSQLSMTAKAQVCPDFFIREVTQNVAAWRLANSRAPVTTATSAV